MMIEKLQKLSGGDPGKAVDILKQSIANGWQGIFELKEKSNARTFKSDAPKSDQSRRASYDANTPEARKRRDELVESIEASGSKDKSALNNVVSPTFKSAGDKENLAIGS